MSTKFAENTNELLLELWDARGRANYVSLEDKQRRHLDEAMEMEPTFPPDLDKSRQVQSRCSQMLRDPPRIFQSGATPDLSSPPLQRQSPGICHFQ